MIYTSYFDNLKNLPKNIIPISICGQAPDWYAERQYKKLAPKYKFFMEWKENKDNNYYIKCFNEQVLDKLDPEKVVYELLITTTGAKSDVCLLCYEKPNEFCHRHLVAKWLNDNGFKCEEYEVN